jgi:hypothetical protein
MSKKGKGIYGEKKEIKRTSRIKPAKEHRKEKKKRKKKKREKHKTKPK